MKLLLILLLASTPIVLSNPVEDLEDVDENLYDVNGDDYLEEPGESIGDMRLVYDLEHDDDDETRSVGTKFSSKTWPGKKVYYKFDSSFRYKSTVQTAALDFKKYTCIRWYPATASTKNYVIFTSKSSGCFADVGFQNRAKNKRSPQRINLGSGCGGIGTIKHEMMHGRHR